MRTTSESRGSSECEDLWRRHVDELTRYCALLVGPNDAADVVSSAFVKASPALASGQVDFPRAYLFRAVTNAAHSQSRSKSNRWRRDLRAVATESVAGHETYVDVRRAVANLSVRQRAVVYLVYWEDMSEVEAADYLRLSAGSVHRHLSRARIHLRKALDV